MIDSFSGAYRFLSNFFPSPISYLGLNYPTVEHAFQAQKTLVSEERLMISRLKNPTDAKREGKKVALRPDWESVKINVMHDLLILKFQDANLRQLLKETGEEELIEGNNWHDHFWGVCRVCNNIGENHLGKQLMKVRGELSC